MAASTAISCRLITEKDVPDAVRLMTRIGVHFGGTKRISLLTAVAREAVTNPAHTLIAVAEQEGDLRAIVIAFTLAPRRYWAHFARRHPLEAFAMARHRLRRTFLRRLARTAVPSGTVDKIGETEDLVGARLEPPGRERWSDDSELIAKVMYVATDPEHRGGGLGSALYSWFFQSLARLRYQRCDAQVSDGNVGAVMLHKRFPFHFIRSDGGYFLWLIPSQVDA